MAHLQRIGTDGAHNRVWLKIDVSAGVVDVVTKERADAVVHDRPPKPLCLQHRHRPVWASTGSA